MQFFKIGFDSLNEEAKSKYLAFLGITEEQFREKINPGNKAIATADIVGVEVTDIEWDTTCEGETVAPAEIGLPDSYVILTEMQSVEESASVDSVIEDIPDILSDMFGFCVFGCNVH